MSKKNEPWLSAAEALKRMNQVRSAVDGASPFLVQAAVFGRMQACTIVELRAAMVNPFQGVSRGGRPVIVALRSSEPTAMLTLDQAIAATEALAASTGEGVPFLAGSSEQSFQLCDIRPTKGGADDYFKVVTRGGVSVVYAMQTIPRKD
ncbi:MULTISPECIES: hypothetical protein [unclassified Variovorax]|uniref:hypothetical protein n=1 Tax=unclassified Variovorax TaxID=663243 RepID=UPI00131900AF|nr:MULTISPECIES: hypothetical protein [unclassified Variovorax]VTU41924.1 hypothetical protein E5P1_00149 [Variovorax sp. PBL-E5]VTU44535.1 hypothetical protein H6P1_00784 [Variovorax sp. PBL-H6]